MSRQATTLRKDNGILQRDNILAETQPSIRHLVEYFEAKCASNEFIKKSSAQSKVFTNKLSVDIVTKPKANENNLPISNTNLEEATKGVLTVFVTPSPESNKSLRKNTSQTKEKEATFPEDPNTVKLPFKRGQSEMHSSFCEENVAPPKKKKRTQDKRLTSEMHFRNEFLQKLFHGWVKKEPSVKPAKTIVDIEIAAKNSCDNVLASHEIEDVLEDLINKLEYRKQEEVSKTSAKTKDSETGVDTDLGSTCLKKTFGEDSQKENQPHAASNLSAKSIRKKYTKSPMDSERDCNSVKQLISNTLNPLKPLDSDSLRNTKTNIVEIDKSSLVNSPSKIKLANPANLLKSLNTVDSHSVKCRLDLEQQKLKLGFETGLNNMESPLKFSEVKKDLVVSGIPEFPDLSPISFKRSPVKHDNVNTTIKKHFTLKKAGDHNPSSSHENASTVCQSAMRAIGSLKDFKTEGGSVENALNKKALFVPQDILRNQLNFSARGAHNKESSQFWITSGDFTASITIHHYDSAFLQLLRSIYAQKGLETREMNFGIDDQKFYLDNSTTPTEINNNLPKENNYSQYWFSRGDTLIPFRGKQMTTKKIRSFFNYIRECMEETGSIRFGIDNYEFSDIYERTQCDKSFLGRESDLDQSDTDLEDYKPNKTFLAVSEHLDNTNKLGVGNQQSLNAQEPIVDDDRFVNHSINQIVKKEQDLETPEILKWKLNGTNTTSEEGELEEYYEFSEYMCKLRSRIMSIATLPLLH